MLRKARLIAPLLRSLVLGAALLPTIAVTGSSLVGCRDENDPLVHVEDLKDPVKQRNAIKRLIQFYADAETEDKKSTDKPNVKAVLDKIIEPLAQVCLDEKVKDQDRSKLVKFMAETRDKRAEPCLAKTLDDYKPDTNEEDVQQVLRAVTEMKLTSLTAQVVKVYQAVEFVNEKARPLRNDMIKALTTLVDKSYEDEFIKILDKPIDPENKRGAFNEGVKQDIAVRVLGELKSEKAAKPLLKFMLTPSKGPLGNTALIALVKIGKAAIPPVEAVLKGEDKELIKHSTDENLKTVEKDAKGKIPETAQKAAERAHIAMAAQILGSLGSEASVQPLLNAIASAGDDVQTKIIVAISLTLLPHVPATEEAYRKVYEELKTEVQFNGRYAKEVLAETSSDFFDDSFAPWLVKTSAELKGGKEESDQLDPIRSSAFVAATKVMTAGQVTEVEQLKAMKAWRMDEKEKKVDTTAITQDSPNARPLTVGEAFKKEFEQAKALLDSCKDVTCFLTAGTSDANQKLDKQFTAIKAIYMVGLMGKDEERNKLIDALPKITNPAVRQASLKAIEHLTPKGDATAADKLQALFDDAEKRKDEKLMAEYAPFVQTASRLRARAQ